MKPLHVKVADALGWTDVELRPGLHSDVIALPAGQRIDLWTGRRPLDSAESQHPMLPAQTGPHSARVIIPRFDTDWSATGPLIEKFKITLLASLSNDPGTAWIATPIDLVQDDHFGASDRVLVEAAISERAFGATPLIAVCNLILALHEAGKLEAA